MATKYAKDDPDHPTLTGTNGSDWLWGDDRDNFIWGLGGDDNIYGGYGNDSLFGGGGKDVLRGADGIDYIDGGAGSDVMTGGKHTDYFIFRDTDGKATDTIRDFSLDYDQLVLENVTITAARTKDVNFDGDKDTVLTLDNGGTIRLLDVTGITMDNLGLLTGEPTMDYPLS